MATLDIKPGTLDLLQNKLNPNTNGLSANASSEHYLSGYLTALVASLVTISVYIFLLAVLFSGVMWTFGSDSEERVMIAKRYLLYSILGLVITLSAAGLANFIISQGNAVLATGLQPTQLTGQIFSVAIGTTSAAFLVLLLVAGLRWLFSMGNEEVIGRSKHQLVNATIGIALTASAYLIGVFIARLLGGIAG